MEVKFHEHDTTFEFTCSDFGTDNNMGLTIIKDDKQIHTQPFTIDGWVALTNAFKKHEDHQHKKTLFQWIENDLLVSGQETQITIKNFDKLVAGFCTYAFFRCLDPY
jgi:hypothetical protein